MSYRTLTGQERVATGTWSSTALDSASGIDGRGDGGNNTSRKAAIRGATFHINNINIDILQIKKEDDQDLT